MDEVGSGSYHMEGFGVSDVGLSGSGVGACGDTEFLLKRCP